jgi:hypothetical protein
MCLSVLIVADFVVGNLRHSGDRPADARNT